MLLVSVPGNIIITEIVNRKFDASSFRDPKSRVFWQGERVFRAVNETAKNDFESVRATGFLEALVHEKKLVPFWDATNEGAHWDRDAESSKVYELEVLPFISYPYEWSFSALKEAAKLQLELQIAALDAGIKLIDASAFNIQFKGPKPIFIDHTSFVPYSEGDIWSGHRQFLDHYLNPLLLMSRFEIVFNDWWAGTIDGVSSKYIAKLLPKQAWLSPKLLTHVLLPVYFERKTIAGGAQKSLNELSKAKLPKAAALNMFRSLVSWVDSLSFKDTGTVWAGYANRNSYQEEEAQKKANFVAQFVESFAPERLVDVGCNTGDYSYVALRAGAREVIGLEADPVALDRAFNRSAAQNLNFLPLYQNVVNPTTAKGWMGQERAGLDERLNADAVIALAVIHHIVFSGHVPLDQAIDWLLDMAPVGIIEFVPPEDPMVRRLLALRKGDTHPYSYELFSSILSRRARIDKIDVVSQTNRTLVSYTRIT